jgi:hypothetical protein
MLESVRSSLYGDNEPEDSTENATLMATDPQARKLASVADKFERTALSLLENSPAEQVNATIQHVLELVAKARLDIENADYGSARSNLSEAFSALDDAKDMARNHVSQADDDSSDDESEDDEDESSGSSDENDNSGSGEDGKQ